MSTEMGLWIDHRRAVIVTLVNGQTNLECIESGMEKHIRPSGGNRSSSPYGPQDVMKEDSRERKYLQHLERYYKKVLQLVKQAGALFIFGPAEAKQEFLKVLRAAGQEQIVAGMEAAERMTTAQIAARVREFFHQEKPLGMGR